MIESVKVILDKYEIKEEQFTEAVKELCMSFDVNYGSYPDCMFEGLAIYNFMVGKTDVRIDSDDWENTFDALQKKLENSNHTAYEKSEY
jgi:hypothetical protein